MLCLRYYRPEPRLAPYVHNYYFVDGDIPASGILADKLMPAAATLRIQRQGAWQYRFANQEERAFPQAALVGPTSSTLTVSTREKFRLFGIDLTGRGLAALTAAPVDQLVDRCLPMHDVLPTRWLELDARLGALESDADLVSATDSFLSAILTDGTRETLRPEGDALLGLLRQSAARGTSVRELARALERSERQVERLARQYLGFSPSMALRRSRFLQVLRAIVADPQASWLDQAGESYYDQSHFVREFKMFSGMTPGSFARRQRQFLGSVEPIRETGDAAGPFNGYYVADEPKPCSVRARRWSCNARSTMEFVQVAS